MYSFDPAIDVIGWKENYILSIRILELSMVRMRN